MRIRLYATLRPLAGGKHVEVDAEPGESVGAILRRLVDLHPALAGQILTAHGAALLPHVQVFFEGQSIRHMQGLATVLAKTGELAVFPPVAGG